MMYKIELDSYELNRIKCAMLSQYTKEKLDYIIKNNSVVILDWLLLPHTHYWKLCDKKILVTAVNDTIRKDKVMKRDCISKDYLDARDAAGINYDNILVDEIIINNYNSNYTGGSITC